MKTKFFLLQIVALFVLTGVRAQDSARKYVNIGLVYPISTNGLEAKSRTNYLSLNAIGGVSYAETGVCVAGFGSVVLDSARGAMVAGFGNVVMGSARGAMVGGFGNLVFGSSKGVQIAGFENVNRHGAGVQVAGFLNKAADVHTQVAGFMNIARKVKGVQVAGFINIADSSDYPVALINIVRNGEMSAGVSTDETLTTLASFRSGGRRLYGIVGFGYNHKGVRSLAAWEAGLGAHLVTTEKFRLNLEVVNIGLTDLKAGDWMKSSFRVLPVYRVSHRIELFAGPSFNYLHARKGQGEGIVDHFVWSERNAHNYYGLFFGATGGITISLTNK